MIKAAFFDIDGTLVPFGEAEMPLRTAETLDRLRKSGVKVFIASGRPRYLIANLRGYPFDGYVCCNGGMVLVGGERIFSKPMDRSDVLRIVEVSGREHIGCVAFAENSLKLNFRTELSDWTTEHLHVTLSDVGDLHGFIERETVYQFTVYCSQTQADALYAPAVKHSIFPRWHPKFMDVTPDDTSKAEGIAKVAGRFGWSMDELMAFGDGGNDIPMLRAVGTGVALGNAAAEVKAAADYVTEDTTENGVAKALEHFGLI